MTRPRSQQINDPSTRYTRVSLNTNPVSGSPSTTIAAVTLNPLSVTQTFGGSELATRAVLTANALDPYALAVGNQFSISVNGASPITVTLQAGDFVIINGGPQTTGHRVANRINSTVGIPANTATRTNDGYLRLQSNSVGANSSISISGSAGILQILGFGNGVTTVATAFGTDPTRGIITVSEDQLGGYVFPSGSDNTPLLSVSNDLYTTGLSPGTASIQQNIPSGQPIYGRLTYDSGTSNYTINWYAKCVGSQPLRSSLSNFVNLNGLDFDLYYLDLFSNQSSLISTTFTPVVNVQNVADQINTSWDNATGGLFGSVITSVPEPYYLNGSLEFRVNGTTNITVSFPGGIKYATDVVNDINASIALTPGTPATATLNSPGFTLASTDPPSGGSGSSIEILSSSDETVLRALGLGVGIYKGWQLCRVVGAEIEISVPSPYSRYSVDGTGLSDLGLSSYPVYPNYTALGSNEVKSGFPYFNASLTPAGRAYSILLPEYMEAGDIPDNNFTENNIEDNLSVNIYKFPDTSVTSNAERFGSQVRYGRDGLIQPNSLPGVIPTLSVGNILFQQSSPYMSYPYTVGSYDLISEGRSFNQPSIRNYISDDGTNNPNYIVTINLSRAPAASQYNSDQNAEPSFLLHGSPLEFSISLRDAATPDPYTEEKDLLLTTSSFGMSRDLILNKDTVLSFPNSASKISDQNISGGPSLQYIPVSDSTNNGNALRAHDQILEQSSLLQHINSRIEITCGDGVDTFGDFNGTTAIDDVVTLLSLDGTLRPVVIKLKAGIYTPANTLSFTRSVTMIGDGNSVTINQPSGGGDTLDFGGTSTNVYLENLIINNNSGSNSVVTTRPIHVVNCNIRSVKLTTASSTGMLAYFLRSDIRSGPASTDIGLDINYGPSSTPPVLLFEGCNFSSAGTNLRSVRITGIAGSSIFQEIKFKDCRFTLASCVVTAAGGGYTLPYSAVNTGLIELNPLNDGRTAAGLVINRLIYENCSVVSQNFTTGTCNIIQLCSAPTDKISTNYASPNVWGTVKSIEFTGCDFTYTLSPISATNVISAFAIGHGVEECIITKCTFNPTQPSSSTGTYGYIPEWWLFTNPSVVVNDSSSILLGAKNVVFSNNKIKDIVPNVARLGSLTSEISFAYGSNLSISENVINANQDTSKRGDGATLRYTLMNVFQVTNVASPLYDTNPNVSLAKNSFVGIAITNVIDEWMVYGILVQGDNLNISNNLLKGWTATNNITPNTALQVSDSNYISASENLFSDTQYGISIGGDSDNLVMKNNFITSGTYRPTGNDSSGIYFNNTNFTARYLEIAGNTVNDLSLDNTFAAIDVVIGQYDGSGITPSDSVEPACFINNNTVNFGGNGSTKYAFRLRPSIPLIAGDRYPKGVLLGNATRINHGPLPSLTPQFGEFAIQKWDNSTTSYVSIAGDDVPRYALIGAQTDNNKVELHSSAAVIVLAGASALTGDPIIISNLQPSTLSGESELHLSFDVTFASTLNAGENITFRIQYSTDGGGTWANVPDSLRLVTAPSNPYNGAFSINVTFNTTSDNIQFDLLTNLAGLVGVNVTSSFIATVKTPKPVYQANTLMLMNSCKLVP